MPQYKSVVTLSGTSYVVGRLLTETKIISDITTNENWGDHLVVTVWTSTDDHEVRTVIIPYHAVELLVK
jgi:hypothetical protein